MDGQFLINELQQCENFESDNNLFDSLWEEYKLVILRSLITSFGLDVLVKDRYGGDVDTIENVRKIGDDPEMTYKNKENERRYNSRGPYDSVSYHADPRYRNIVRKAKTSFNETGEKIRDTYVTDNELVPGRSASKQHDNRAELDHTISAHSIHDDRGRILANLEGKDLANDPENLRFTNAHLNNNKRDMSAQEYIDWCEQNPEKVNWNGEKGAPLPEDVKTRLLAEEKAAKEWYERRINATYYTSRGFYMDVTKAATKRGIQMGIREGLGIVFLEILVGIEEEMKAVPAQRSLSEILLAVEKGLRKGIERCRNKYKEIISAIEEGFFAGAMASITTTICNIFSTVSKKGVKIIRQIYPTVIQAGKTLFFNPDNLLMGDRVKKTSIILATGASVIVGTSVGDVLRTTAIGASGTIGNAVCVFCSTLVSGILACTLLLFMDRSKWMNALFDMMNQIPSDAYNFKEIADIMEDYAARLSEIDIVKFRQDTKWFNEIAREIENSKDEEEINQTLRKAYEQIGIKIPWDGDFDSFIKNQENHLVFS